MKFTLTITDASAADITRLMASINDNPQPVNVTPQPPMLTGSPTPAAGDDDEGGDNSANAPEMDGTGLPWDERIHSKGKTLTDAGHWRKKKGVSDTLVSQVEAELRARSAPQPMPQPMFDTGTPAPQPVQPVTMPTTMVPIPQQMPMQPPAPAPQPMPQPIPQQPMQQPAPAPQPASAPAAMDFPTFMQHLSGQMRKLDANGQPLVTTEYLATITGEIAGAFNVHLNSFTEIGGNPAMINYAVQLLQRDNRWN